MKGSRNEKATGGDPKRGSNRNKRGDRGGSGGSAVVQIDLDVYRRRMDCLLRSWENLKEDLWLGVDAIAVVTSAPTDNYVYRYGTSSALPIWLFEYELPETVMMFLPGYLHILCSLENAGVLEILQNVHMNVEVVLHPKATTNDGRVEMQNILDIVKRSRREVPELGGVWERRPIVGYLQNEAPHGTLMEDWSVLLQGSGLILVDVERGFSDLFAVKDESMIINIRTAASLSSSVLKSYVVPKLLVGIENKKTMSHAEFSSSTAEQIKYPPNEVKLDLKEDDMDICYPPIFQSGGPIDIQRYGFGDNNRVDYYAKAVINCALGVRYRSYCSNIARTYLIDPDAFQHKAYKVLREAHAHALNILMPGMAMSDVYKIAIAIVHDDGPEFVPHLTVNIGTGIGIKLVESELTLCEKNNQFVKSGMVFNVATGFHRLKTPPSENPRRNRTFSLLLADTVVVTDEGPEITTSQCSKSDIVITRGGSNRNKRDDRGGSGGSAVVQIVGLDAYM